jgi:membrane protein YqaA with SNARE-associated domain
MRKLYNWILNFASHPQAIKFMMFFTFIEASFFVIPPYPLQIAISIQNTKRALWIAFLNTIASVAGGLLGYAIGYFFWEWSQDFFFKFIFSEKMYDSVAQVYANNAIVALITASVTPLPFKVMAVIGGATHAPLGTFIVGSLLGRSLRFFAVGIPIYIWGAPVKHYIDKYLERIVLAVTTVIVIFFALYYFWSHS